MDKKEQFLERIRSNIEKHKFHVTTVFGGIEPRYCYTIGLSEMFGFELVFAGGFLFLLDDLILIFEAMFEEFKNNTNLKNQKISVGNLGTFSLAEVHPSWSKLMMLGVFDYYKISTVVVYQIMPDRDHYTLEIPNMTKMFDASLEPIWQWLVCEWKLNVPKESTVATNINALLGEPVTEITRWENDYWEMFAGAGPDVLKEETRIISLGTMLGIDKSLSPALDLAIGEGLWRSGDESEWNSWIDP